MLVDVKFHAAAMVGNRNGARYFIAIVQSHVFDGRSESLISIFYMAERRNCFGTLEKILIAIRAQSRVPACTFSRTNTINELCRAIGRLIIHLKAVP